MALTSSSSEHFASFEAKNDPLEDVRVFVQTALLETPLPKKAIAGLMLAVEEAVTNILRHGYLYGPGRVRIRVRRTRRWVSIIISDTGRPYTMNVDGAPDAQQLADTGRRGGLGMYLIKRVTDHLDLQRVGDENVLTMSKRLHAGMRRPIAHSSMRKRVAWTGALAVLVFVLLGAWIIERQATGRVTRAFFDQWSQFGRSAAAAASQHILNDRSDAEFDQLVVDLKAAHPGLDYLVILSELPLEDGTADVRIRAHSESPELVHDVYTPPKGVPAGDEGEWLVDDASHPTRHFAQHVRVGGRVVGTVVWGVPEASLSGSVNSVLLRVGQWAGIALLGGWILVLVGAAWTTKPIQKLVDTLRNSGSAGGEPESLMAEPEEIREVVAAFQEATESVAQSERQMAERDMQQRELEASRHLQRALMPQALPEIEGYVFGAQCRMARQVGGDYYDVLRLADGRWLIIVADVAGKGLPAGLIMTAFRTATRLLTPLHSTPRSLLGALQQYLVENHQSGPFVTACCVALDPEQHQIEICSAGHTPAILRPAHGDDLRQINPRGRPIGLPIAADQSFADRLESEVITLLRGDRLLLFTDGLTDARSSDGDSFGIERIEACLRETINLDPKAFVSEIVQRVDHFSDGADPVDDLTLVTLDRVECLVRNSDSHPDRPAKDLKEPQKAGATQS